MSTLSRAVCRVFNHRRQISSPHTVRKVQCTFPENGLVRTISTTCKCFSDEEKNKSDVRKNADQMYYIEKVPVDDTDKKFIVGRLIGKHGSNIKRISDMVGCEVFLNQLSVPGYIQVKVMDKEKLAKAVDQVTQHVEKIKKTSVTKKQDLVPESPTYGINADQMYYIEKVPVDDTDKKFIVGRLIGKHGSNIKRISDMVGCQVSVEKLGVPGYIAVKATDKEKLASAVNYVKQNIEELKTTYETRKPDMAPESPTYGSNPEQLYHTERVPLGDADMNYIIRRVVGKGGSSIRKISDVVGCKVFVEKLDVPGYIEVKVMDKEKLAHAVDQVTQHVEKIKKTSETKKQDLVPESPTYGMKQSDHDEPTTVDWDAVLSGNTERLGIFEKSDLTEESSRIETPMWDRLEAAEQMERRKAYSVNSFDKMICLTEEGKLWKFPINNDQDQTEEENVTFDEHVFLDHLIEDFPKKGPVRHFMELVLAGLSKNPYMSVKEKHEHIEWYRNYFTQNEHLLEEELGDLGKMRQLPQQV
ncbi:insulin-like growth factor 2 mRNA-binding protein 1 [Ylistrum balloti]|uniref:insulin-like growth factor 2 mRNA-binding protein 1 n=1 Tax=Ylistrum balloti TaxID=509963 RepID=UPI002905DAAA|nr:insulin-like growth factor 2 mRNA-binding protein 1 [Ylistrum balloti]